MKVIVLNVEMPENRYLIGTIIEVEPSWHHEYYERLDGSRKHILKRYVEEIKEHTIYLGGE